MRGFVARLVMAAVVMSCAVANDGPRSIALPIGLGSPLTCAGVGTEAVLAGAPDDPRVTWIVSSLGGETPVLWPAGWTAQFSPGLRVFDPSGQEKYVAGSYVSGICLAQTASGQPAVMLPDLYSGPARSSGPD